MTTTCPVGSGNFTTGRAVWRVALIAVPFMAALFGCGDSGDDTPLDETVLPENQGVEYGEVERLSASLGGLMRFDDDRLRILYSDFDRDGQRGSFAIMHGADPDLDRNVVAPNGTVLVVGEYRVELETNADGDSGFGFVSKAIDAG